MPKGGGSDLRISHSQSRPQPGKTIRVPAVKLVSTNKKTSMVKSNSLGSVFCPKCHRIGQLKVRTNIYGRRYAQVDHWNTGNCHSSGMKSSCYLRPLIQKEYLSTQDPQTRKFLRTKLVGAANSTGVGKTNTVGGNKASSIEIKDLQQNPAHLLTSSVLPSQTPFVSTVSGMSDTKT